jgi:hypothetical protein
MVPRLQLQPHLRLSQDVLMVTLTLCALQVVELQRVSSRLQGILMDYNATFDRDILEPQQFARGVVTSYSYFHNPVMIGGGLGAQSCQQTTATKKY